VTGVILVEGVVVDDSPLTVSIEGGEAALTARVATWTPTPAESVWVLVDATTKARLVALGPIA
jgi:hypothetical protein